MNARHASRRVSGGFTLLELLIALTVMAILVSLGFPSLQEMIRNNQVSAQNAELVSIFQFAKSEAIRRNTDVPVQLMATAAGWNVIVEDPAEEADVEGCSPGQLRCASYRGVAMGMSLPGGGSVLTFNNRGYIVNPGDPLVFANAVLFLQHHQCAGNGQRNRIEITATGQVDSCAVACADTETECGS